VLGWGGKCGGAGLVSLKTEENRASSECTARRDRARMVVCENRVTRVKGMGRPTWGHDGRSLASLLLVKGDEQLFSLISKKKIPRKGLL